MNKKKLKKGVSTIVATTLLILITVSAIVLLVSFIKPFVQNGLDDSTKCLAYKDYYSFQDRFENDGNFYSYNCYDETANGALIGSMVKTGTNLSNRDSERLSGFAISYSTESLGSESISFIDGKEVTHAAGGIWRLDDLNPENGLVTNKPNEIITYVFNSGNVYAKAEIYPLLKDGSICDISDTVEISKCSGVDLGP